jgi:hypothetical protein
MKLVYICFFAYFSVGEKGLKELWFYYWQNRRHSLVGAKGVFVLAVLWFIYSALNTWTTRLNYYSLSLIVKNNIFAVTTKSDDFIVRFNVLINRQSIIFHYQASHAWTEETKAVFHTNHFAVHLFVFLYHENRDYNIRLRQILSCNFRNFVSYVKPSELGGNRIIYVI